VRNRTLRKMWRSQTRTYSNKISGTNFW